MLRTTARALPIVCVLTGCTPTSSATDVRGKSALGTDRTGKMKEVTIREAGANGCQGFPDIAGKPVPGVATGVAQAAADSLKCSGRLPGYFETCPDAVVSATGKPLCPDEERAVTYPGKHVFCGSCLATRLDAVTFAINSFADANALVEIQGCASDGRCADWRLCSEVSDGGLSAVDWKTNYLGWAMKRGLFRGDGQPSPGEVRTCRPHEPALWIEVATIVARVSGHDDLGSTSVADEIDETHQAITDSLAARCRIAGVEKGGSWWVPATVALNNSGVLCMPENANGQLTSNICGSAKLGECYVTRAVLATVAARIRGDVALADCPDIDIAESSINCD